MCSRCHCLANRYAPESYERFYESKIDKALMKKWVYPVLKPHQKVMSVPGLFGDSSLNASARAAWEALLVEKMQGHWEWAQADPRVVGMNP